MKKKHLRGGCSNEAFCRFLSFCLRTSLIATGLGFTVNGWAATWAKFSSGKTSFSITLNETEMFTYPSITFCPGFKDDDFADGIRGRLIARKANASKVEKLIKKNSYARRKFMDMFRHPMLNEEGGEITDWTESTPNMRSGKCFTYDPQFESFPLRGNGMHFKIIVPSTVPSKSVGVWIPAFLKIFLHERDKFFYYNGYNMPGHSMVNPALFKREKEMTMINIHFSRTTNINTKKRPCISDTDYSFVKCFERAMSNRRGCQKPWLYFPEFGIDKCEDVDQLLDLLDSDLDKSGYIGWSATKRADKSGCLRPCTYNNYELQYEYQKLNNSVSHIYFENFNFRYEEEYLVCDWTCLIGEIGGNFGFFLGGSILSLYDVIYSGFQSKVISKLL